MDPLEFQAWKEYFARWPFDDRSRYHRPAAYIGSLVTGGEVEVDKVLDWLDRKPPPDANFLPHELAMFKAAGVKPPRKG